MTTTFDDSFPLATTLSPDGDLERRSSIKRRARALGADPEPTTLPHEVLQLVVESEGDARGRKRRRLRDDDLLRLSLAAPGLAHLRLPVVERKLAASRAHLVAMVECGPVLAAGGWLESMAVFA